MNYLILIGYWLFFFRHILFNPYRLAYGEGLDCDFPTQRLCGEYWRKGKLPKDPYYFQDLIGQKAGTLYPVNVLFAYIGSFLKLDSAWMLNVWNILLHSLATSIFAYHLFGGGLIGLFGGLAWGYYGYHIKQNLWYAQTFTWITATLFFLETHQFILAGISWGMLWLSGTPPLWVYFGYLMIGYIVIKGILPVWAFIIAFFTASYQLHRYGEYRLKSVKKDETYQDKVKVGKVPIWIYLTMFIPIRIRDYINGVGYEEMAFYVTPLVGFFALFGKGNCWLLILTTVLFSLGGGVFKLFSKFMFRFPQRWGYFVGLGVIVLAVDGLRRFNLAPTNLILLNVLLGILFLFNRSLLPIHPFAQWTKRPSRFFDTPLLQYLEKNAEGYRVNNLPYPVYTGQINHIRSMGYCGGNHPADFGRFRNISEQGCCGNNWFNYLPDGTDLDNFGVKYHIGHKPSNLPKWKKVKEFDLWENANI